MEQHSFDGTDLLRYRKFDMNTLQMIVNNQLYYSYINHYNDPAEVLLDFTFSENVQAYENFKNKYPEFKTIIDKIIEGKYKRNPKLNKNAPSEIDDKYYTEIKHSIQSAYCCCSFCKGNLNTLMFAHYADSFRGICLVYDGSIDYFKEQQPITYINYYHKTFTGFMDSIQKMENAYLRKDVAWSYEQEYRLLKMPSYFTRQSENDKGYLDATIKKRILKQIILGSRISENDMNLLLRLRKKGLFQAEIWRSDISNQGIVTEIIP